MLTHGMGVEAQILGASRAFLQLVERMVQIEPMDFFLFIFFLSYFLHFILLEQHLKSYKWLRNV